MSSNFEKVKAYKKKLLDLPVRLDVERLKFLLEVYTQTEGESTITRRSKVFEKLCSEKTIFIDENPIVGTVGCTPNALVPMPEYSCNWMRKQLVSDTFRTGLGKVASARLSEDEKKHLSDAIAYWGNKNAHFRGCQIYDETYPSEATAREQVKGGILIDQILGSPLGFVILDYEKVLKIGMNGIIKEIEAAMANLPVGLLDTLDKRYFCQAAIRCLRAMINLSHRYAALARNMAKQETDTERRQELLEIAEVCEWVPANPARSLREACQSYWFTTLGALMETSNAAAIAPGRFCTYMYPFYKQDKEQGKITEEQAMALLGWTFLRIQGYGQLSSSWRFGANSGQTAMHLSIGGLTPDGEDATNELDYLVLEVQKRLRLTQPSLTLLWHDKLPEDFLLKVVDLVRTGIGQPQFLNNEKAIARLLYFFPGLSLEEARGHANIGCVPTRPSHNSSNLWGAALNMGKIMELVLYNGKDPLTGIQLGLKTGNAKDFASYEQFQTAVDKQIAYLVDRGLAANRISFSILAEVMPLPYQSCFLDDCIKRGKDIQHGGARHSTNYMLPVGTVDLGNSLAAIKKMVFEEKKFTIEELKQALEANLEGGSYSEIHNLCLKAPKYGNDDDYADSIVKHCYEVFAREHVKYLDVFGNVAHPEAFSSSIHNATGLKCGALPSGKKAKLPHTDATVSAYPGTDRKGPTALVRSATKVINTMEFGSNHLNMKFHPSALEGVAGARNLLSLVKTYMDWGGHHLQFNCINSETLKDAQRHPENYRDLVVRVAGFSAYFVNLETTIQDEIIKRTELRFA